MTGDESQENTRKIERSPPAESTTIRDPPKVIEGTGSDGNEIDTAATTVAEAKKMMILHAVKIDPVTALENIEGGDPDQDPGVEIVRMIDPLALLGNWNTFIHCILQTIGYITVFLSVVLQIE